MVKHSSSIVNTCMLPAISLLQLLYSRAQTRGGGNSTRSKSVAAMYMLIKEKRKWAYQYTTSFSVQPQVLEKVQDLCVRDLDWSAVRAKLTQVLPRFFLRWDSHISVFREGLYLLESLTPLAWGPPLHIFPPWSRLPEINNVQFKSIFNALLLQLMFKL